MVTISYHEKKIEIQENKYKLILVTEMFQKDIRSLKGNAIIAWGLLYWKKSGYKMHVKTDAVEP